MPNSDIQTAIDTIKANLPARELFTKYYDGQHDMAFATEKFKTAFGRTLESMRDNLCPIIVDAPADRLEIINFSGDSEAKTTDEATWALWQREKMELVSYDTHVEALKTGAGYVIVWSDNENKARFFLQDSRNCVVIEDEDTGDPIFGAKQWKTAEERIRLNLYYADRIEKYITRKKPQPGQELKASAFEPLTATNSDGETVETAYTPNPYGVIPMFCFETNPCLSDAIPIQDGLNKSVIDMMVAMEFAAFPQRWATGLEPPMDELTGAQKVLFKGGVDRLWFASDATTKFGEFGTANLEQFLKVGDSYRLEMARVSGTPLHFFSINTSDAISGEALKTLESRFTKKCSRLQINFGAEWAKVMKFAMRIEGAARPENLTAQWATPEQRSEKEMLEAAVIKQDLGVPRETLLEEIGYTEEDIAGFDLEGQAEEERQAKEDAVKLATAQQNGK